MGTRKRIDNSAKKGEDLVKAVFHGEVKLQLNRLAKVFAEGLVLHSRSFYTSKPGGLNRFKGSKVVKSVKALMENSDLTIKANDYIEYLERGRKPRVRKVPIQVLIKWMAASGISGGMKTAFKIQSSIYRKGISPRNFIEPSIKSVIKELDKISDEAFKKLTDKL
jgi:hypothetical protein